MPRAFLARGVRLSAGLSPPRPQAWPRYSSPFRASPAATLSRIEAASLFPDVRIQNPRRSQSCRCGHVPPAANCHVERRAKLATRQAGRGLPRGRVKPSHPRCRDQHEYRQPRRADPAFALPYSHCRSWLPSSTPKGTLMPWRIGNVPLPVPGMAVAGPTSAAHSFGTALECCINLEQSMGSAPAPRNLYGALMSLSIQGIIGAKGTQQALALFLGR